MNIAESYGKRGGGDRARSYDPARGSAEESHCYGNRGTTAGGHCGEAIAHKRGACFINCVFETPRSTTDVRDKR